jgi:type II secretory pathway pseudopilin PulG
MKPARCRAQAEGGFALIELLISMTVLVVGMFALLATFTSGYTTLNRADVKGSATMLADRTMETYRGKLFTDIAAGTPCPPTCSLTTTTTYSGASTPPSPDGRTYSVTSVATTLDATNTQAGNTTSANPRSIKVVVVTVADASGKTWVTERSTFEELSASSP